MKRSLLRSISELDASAQRKNKLLKYVKEFIKRVYGSRCVCAAHKRGYIVFEPRVHLHPSRSSCVDSIVLDLSRKDLIQLEISILYLAL